MVSSASRNISQRPFAAAMPRLRAAETPSGAPSFASSEKRLSRAT